VYLCMFIYIYIYIYKIIIRTHKLIYIISYFDREVSTANRNLFAEKEKRKNRHKSKSLLLGGVFFCDELDIS